MDRLDLVKNQITANNLGAATYSQIGVKSPDDVVICCAVRTALTKAKKGPQANSYPEQMLVPVLDAICDKTKIDPKLIEDIAIGNVLQTGSGFFSARMGQLMGKIPDSTPLSTINRACSSGLEACSVIASKIKSGVIDIGIGGGVENMSIWSMQNMADPSKLSQSIYDVQQAADCLLPMGITSENVAEKYGISRQTQDQFAVISHAKAAKAQKSGYFKDEIIPYYCQVKDKEGNVTKVLVDKDDGLREGTTLESLAKMKAVFKKDGSTTAGNASQLTEGAAGVLFARRDVANKLGLPILGKFVSYSVVGCPPNLMGIGPSVAIPKALQKASLQVKDVGIYEINEAFASQATYCVDKLGIDINKVNPKGGAIALGHPLGCTGARQICTLLPELKRTNQKIGVVSMCIGTGMGAAGVFENEQN